MATLYVRARSLPSGDRRFDVKYRRAGRFTALEHGGTFHTRKEANARRDKIAEWLAVGLNPRVELRRTVTPSRTIAELQEVWLAGKRRITPETRRGYRSRVNRINEALGDFQVDELHEDDVIAWVGSMMDEELAATTVVGHLGQLRMILDLHEGPNVARSRRVERPRIVLPEIDPPDADEVLAMLDGLGDYVLPVLTMEQLGSRVSETLTLQPRDIHAGVVRFRREETKGRRRSRTVPVNDLLADALLERLPFKTTRVTVWRKMTEGDGMHIHPHLLRHRRGSLWHQQGVVAAELARRLGHAKTSTTLDIYSHAGPLREIPDHDLAALLR